MQRTPLREALGVAFLLFFLFMGRTGGFLVLRDMAWILCVYVCATVSVSFSEHRRWRSLDRSQNGRWGLGAGGGRGDRDWLRDILTVIIGLDDDF